METIHLTHPYSDDQIIEESNVLALGFFDGIHLGHQELLRRARQVADQKNLPLALMTFEQHPKILYSSLEASSVRYLTINQRKTELLEQLGVDILYYIDFTWEFGSQPPQEFVDNYIVGLNAEVIVAGFDYTYGKKDIANMSTLPEHAKGRFEIIEISKLKLNHHKVSSRFIIENIRHGKIENANNELGYTYQIMGEVVDGEKRGRELGYPTANIKPLQGQLLPRVGVYVTSVFVKGQWYKAMTSIGYNITFEGNRGLSIEANLLDFNQMIYGETVRIRWHRYLRDELKFESADDLILQLEQDAKDTDEYFVNHPLSQVKGDLNA